MKTRLAAAGAILLLAGTPVSAHRLDEYLQATTISVEKDRVEAQIRLTPGVAVFHIVLSRIDTDRDGVISEAERRAYAEEVLRDLSIAVDGDRLSLRLVASKFAKIEEMKEGVGEIELDFDADVPSGRPNRILTFENRHQSSIAAYLVNCLVPRDPAIRITGQNRNYQQSFYQLDYLQGDVRSKGQASAWWSSSRGWLGVAAILLLAVFGFGWRRVRVTNQSAKLKHLKLHCTTDGSGRSRFQTARR